MRKLIKLILGVIAPWVFYCIWLKALIYYTKDNNHRWLLVKHAQALTVTSLVIGVSMVAYFFI
jgi:hypothetical protein